MAVSTGKTSCAKRRGQAVPRLAGAALLLAWASLSSLNCVGDLVSPAAPRVSYAFASPLPDTTINIGEASRVLPCSLTANGRAVACRLDVRMASGARVLTYVGGRIQMDSLGTAVIAMRPANAQLPNDTIVRTAAVRGVAPQVRFGVAGTEDTLIAVGQEKLIIAMATTVSGRIIMGAPIRWTQDSGTAVAMLVAGAPGWIRALGNGVAVFRASTDTASATRRVLVQLLRNPTSGANGSAATPLRGRGGRR